MCAQAPARRSIAILPAMPDSPATLIGSNAGTSPALIAPEAIGRNGTFQ